MPVRKALARLEAEGLVLIEPQVGTTVHIPGNDELKEIWNTRALLEEFVAISLAKKTFKRPATFEGIQETLRTLTSPSDGTPAPATQHEFLVYHYDFHCELAKVAGYTSLAKEIRLLQLRAHLARRRNVFWSFKQMRTVVEEHDRILSSIRPPLKDSVLGQSAGEWPHPDTNEIRLAMRIHLRNMAHRLLDVDRLQKSDIGPTLSDNSGFLDDTPEIRDRKASTPLSFLLGVRAAVELAAVCELASRPGLDLRRLDANIARMQEIYSRLSTVSSLKSADCREVLNLDIEFHSSLGFLSGMLFAEEAVVYIWWQHWDQQRHAETSTPPRLGEIIDEHSSILDAIRRSRGTSNDVIAAVRAAGFHFRRAVELKSLERSSDDLGILVDDLCNRLCEWVRIDSALQGRKRSPR